MRRTDGMTADFLGLRPIQPDRDRNINEVKSVNRLVHDLKGKPPDTIEWEQERGENEERDDLRHQEL